MSVCHYVFCKFCSESTRLSSLDCCGSALLVRKAWPTCSPAKLCFLSGWLIKNKRLVWLTARNRILGGVQYSTVMGYGSRFTQPGHTFRSWYLKVTCYTRLQARSNHLPTPPPTATTTHKQTHHHKKKRNKRTTTTKTHTQKHTHKNPNNNNKSKKQTKTNINNNNNKHNINKPNKTTTKTSQSVTWRTGLSRSVYSLR